jgi:hypothetical protein
MHVHFHSHYGYGGTGDIVSTYISAGIIIGVLVVKRLWSSSGYLARKLRVQ